MTKDDIILEVKRLFGAEGDIDIDTDTVTLDSNGVDHIAERVATIVQMATNQAKTELVEQVLSCDIKVTITKELCKRLWRVLVTDGEQFVAGELKKIAQTNGFTLG